MQFIKGFNTIDFRLDIVGFLAILGEASLEPIAQTITLSKFVYLPRIIPAPQVFIRPQRPEKLETNAKAKVIGIHSGNTGETIHHVAHALHRGDKLAANSVKLVRITEHEKHKRPSVKRGGPLMLLSLIGFTMSATLLGLAIYYQDGMAVLAIASLSGLSTVTGLANKWDPTPQMARPDTNSPPGDVAIKYPQGAFIIVLCDEVLARYLYFNTSERCVYTIKSEAFYRFLSLVATLLLMCAFICLANATIQLQTGFAAAYMLINIFYWVGAALPPGDHWDMRGIRIEEIQIKGGIPPRDTQRELSRNDAETPITYTEALWKSIAVTRSMRWVKKAEFAPETNAWDEWLHEAEHAAQSEDILKSNMGGEEVWKVRDWDSRKALSTCLSSQLTRARPLPEKV